MRPRPLAVTAAVAVLALLVAGCSVALASAGSHRATIVMPAASNLVAGTAIQIDGHDAGRVEEISTRDGQAWIDISVDDAYAPLHDGTTARIRWKALIGERILEVLPGPPTNAPLPEGAIVVGGVAPVEIDDALSALDEPTRQRLVSLVEQLDGTLAGDSDQDVNRTLQTAGPAVDALGRVLQGVGSDGPAIKTLLTHLNQLTGRVAQRRSDVSQVVEQLSGATGELVKRRAELRDTLHELPSTLATIQSTMDKVPAATDATVPLLKDIEPATAKLPSVASNLAPLLADLRPATAELRPTLQAANVLLGRTPALLDTAHLAIPKTTNALDSSKDAAAFLRPYTPEIVGFLANWGSHSANYDGTGHYARVLAPQSASSLTANPGVAPPGVEVHRAPLPGELEGQPWTDATGSGIR